MRRGASPARAVDANPADFQARIWLVQVSVDNRDIRMMPRRRSARRSTFPRAIPTDGSRWSSSWSLPSSWTRPRRPSRKPRRTCLRHRRLWPWPNVVNWWERATREATRRRRSVVRPGEGMVRKGARQPTPMTSQSHVASRTSFVRTKQIAEADAQLDALRKRGTEPPKRRNSRLGQANARLEPCVLDRPPAGTRSTVRFWAPGR